MGNMPNNNPIQQINSQIANQNANVPQNGQQFDEKKARIIKNLIARLFKNSKNQNPSSSQPSYQEMMKGGKV